jgi:glycine hydroxymethyltransferase
MIEVTMDQQLQSALQAEEERQRSGLELIPSENYVSRAVLDALGTVFTNKYSEGYPGRRYYGGQEHTDTIETLAIERAKALFGADHANVQPYSGAPANLAAYLSWCEPGDTILAMDLSHGGHLTHGHPLTAASRIFNFVRYGMADVSTGRIDYDQVRELARKHRPKILLVGHSAYPRQLDYDQFASIAVEVGAVAMADMAHLAGLIAGGVMANPLDHGFQIMTSTTHKTLRGPRGGLILSRGTVSSPLKAPEHTMEHLPTLVDRAVFPGLQGGPHMSVVLAKAVAFAEAATPEFRQYAAEVLSNAQALSSGLVDRGLVLVTGGTDNHLMVIDTVASLGISGGEAEAALDAVGLTANKNVIPDDTRPAYDPSGLRLGTPALTTRGMGPAHMDTLAGWIQSALAGRGDSARVTALRAEVQELASSLPLPSDIPAS